MDYRTLFANVRRRPGLYGLDGSFGQYCAFLTGLDTGNAGQLLVGLREWLVVRVGTGNNLVWPALVKHAAFPGQHPFQGLDEQHLVDTLFDLLDEFWEIRSRHDGTTRVFDEYLTWLKAQSWYRG